MTLKKSFYYLGILSPFSLVQIPMIGELFPILIVLLAGLLLLSNPKVSPLAIYLFSAMPVVSFFVSVLLTSDNSWTYVFQQYLLLSCFLFIFTCSHREGNRFYFQQFGYGFLVISPIISSFGLLIFLFELLITDISEFGSYLGHPVVHGFLGEPKQFAALMIAALTLEFFLSTKFSIYQVKLKHLLYVITLILTFSVSGILNGVIILVVVIFLKSSFRSKIFIGSLVIASSAYIIQFAASQEPSNLLLVKIAAPLLFLPLDGLPVTFLSETPNYVPFGLGFDALRTIPSLALHNNTFTETYSRLEVFQELFDGDMVHFSPSIFQIKMLVTFGAWGLALLITFQMRFALLSCIEDRSKKILYAILPMIILISYPVTMLLLIVANSFSFRRTGGRK